MPELGDDDDFDLENLEVTGGDEDGRRATSSSRDDVEDAPIVRFVNKMLLDAIKKGASDIHFEPYEKHLPHPLAHGRRAEGDRAAAGAARDQARGAHQGHVAARHRRAARAAGRPHQDEAVEDSRDRLPRQHLPDAVRREDRDAVSSIRRARSWASTRWATSRSRRSSTCKTLAQPLRHDPGDRPDRQRQDRVAVHRPQHPEQAEDTQHLDRRRPGRNQPARRQPGQRQRQGRPHLRRGAARVPAPGSGHHHGRRNPRPRDGRDRDQGRADRPPGAVDAAHQRRAEDADAPASTWA